MSPEILAKTTVSIVSTALCTIMGMFINFLVRKGDGTVLGLTLPTESIHFILGPFLLILNSALVIFLFALYAIDITEEQLRAIKAQEAWFFFGPICNPFYIGRLSAMNNIGYAFIIVLWWLGMHSFLYSIEQNASQPLLYGWQILFSVLFLALGLVAMWGIQLC
jgi:hypothetical protein